MAKRNNMLIYAGVAVAVYFGYRYAVQNLMIPDYIGLLEGYPRTQGELNILLMGSGGPAAGPGIAPGEPNPITPDSANGITPPYSSVTPTTPNNRTKGSGGKSKTPTDTGDNLVNPTAAANAKDALWSAAQGEATANGGRLHFWSWNYYLPDTVSKPDPFALGDAAWSGTPLGSSPKNEQEVLNTMLTLDQYWAMVAPVVGLSGGMSGINGWGGISSAWWGGSNGYAA